VKTIVRNGDGILVQTAGGSLYAISL
jgi:hypothetical protein